MIGLGEIVALESLQFWLVLFFSDRTFIFEQKFVESLLKIERAKEFWI